MGSRAAARRRVKTRPGMNVRNGVACTLMTLLLVGCASKAPDYHGKWRPVNRLAEQPQEIPLHGAYVFSVSPRDYTLRGLLMRWMRDNRMTLSYLSDSDFTLYGPVGDIHTSDLEEALRELGAAYAAQGLEFGHEGGQVVVRRATRGDVTDKESGANQ